MDKFEISLDEISFMMINHPICKTKNNYYLSFEIDMGPYTHYFINVIKYYFVNYDLIDNNINHLIYLWYFCSGTTILKEELLLNIFDWINYISIELSRYCNFNNYKYNYMYEENPYKCPYCNFPNCRNKNFIRIVCETLFNYKYPLNNFIEYVIKNYPNRLSNINDPIIDYVCHSFDYIYIPKERIKINFTHELINNIKLEMIKNYIKQIIIYIIDNAPNVNIDLLFSHKFIIFLKKMNKIIELPYEEPNKLTKYQYELLLSLLFNNKDIFMFNINFMSNLLENKCINIINNKIVMILEVNLLDPINLCDRIYHNLEDKFSELLI